MSKALNGTANMYSITILFSPDGQQAELQLMEGETLLDQLIIPIDIHFDTMLVTSIDKIIKKNRIEKSSLRMVQVAPREDLSSVSYRTAQAVAEAIKSQQN